MTSMDAIYKAAITERAELEHFASQLSSTDEGFDVSYHAELTSKKHRDTLTKATVIKSGDDVRVEVFVRSLPEYAVGSGEQGWDLWRVFPSLKLAIGVVWARRDEIAARLENVFK